MTSKASFPENALDPYGTPLQSYRGTGQLTLSTSHKLKCQFVAGQLENGKTVMLCATSDPFLNLITRFASPQSFAGRTDEGYSVDVDQIVSETPYLPEATAQGSNVALRIGHLHISKPGRRVPRLLTFLLTNLSRVRSDVPFTFAGITFQLHPLEDLSNSLARLEVMRGVLPTVELRAMTRVPLAQVTDAVDEVCYLLSIAVGTKVQSIAVTEATAKGEWLSRHHYSRVTKRYGPLSVLDPSNSGVEGFLHSSSDGFTHAKEQVGLTGAAIDTYLDAKAEGDFLQVRALKLVVAVEMLKAGYLDRIGSSGLILAEDEFEDRRRQLKKAIKTALDDLTPHQRKSVYGNLRGLNRDAFEAQLQRLCTAIRMPLESDDLRRFVVSRNKLVHEGHFYCEKPTERERAKVAPLPSVTHEWFWLLHFVDRLFLRAVGYEGPYIDWSTPGSPAPCHLSPGA